MHDGRQLYSGQACLSREKDAPGAHPMTDPLTTATLSVIVAGSQALRSAAKQ